MAAQFLVAHRQMYFAREKPEEKLEAKLYWMARSANKGYRRAMNEVGQAFKAGEGTHKDVAAARRWFERALPSEADAAYNLGLIHLEAGREVEAVKLFRLAAARGSASGIYNLAVGTLKGAAGITADPTEAARLFEREGSAQALWTAWGILTKAAGHSSDAKHKVKNTSHMSFRAVNF